MLEKLYKQLAVHLDRLPGGYPPTESGVELRILKRLFTEEEAKTALLLNLIPEEADTLAVRAGGDAGVIAQRLEEMAAKGLIIRTKRRGQKPRYMAAQFVVGIWELQVNRLSPELVADMDAYIPHLLDAEAWKKAPQMRTIPVGRSIDTELPVMTYENAAALVRKKKRFVVADCICRKERNIHGDGCDKTLETCISFGGSEDFFLKNGIGRRASLEEVLELLEKADRAGLVLQPSNGKKIDWICCCCGCCCGILRNLKNFPAPASIAATPFTLEAETKRCTGCGVCVVRCQMDALTVEGGAVVLNSDRCIGCGLCVSTCAANSLKLVRKEESLQPRVPSGTAEAMLRLGWKRKKIGPARFAKMGAESLLDRYRASRRS